MNPRPLVLVFALVAGCGAASAPPAPQIGELVDTVGRPLIAAVLVSPFASADDHAAAAASWKSAGAQARASALLPALAAFDSLDGSCGNQLAAGAAGPSRYQPLAARLADDRLLIDSRAAPCERLLAVESGLATDCGGLPLTVDSVDVMLSFLVAGAPTGVGDGVDRDPDGSPDPSRFPFLLEPTF